MASRNMDAPMVFGKKTKFVIGSFATNGSSAVDQTSIKGKGIASVARNSAGNFTVTLSDGYQALWFAEAHVQQEADADLVAKVGTVSNVGSTTGAAVTAVIRLLVGATATDLAAAATSRVSFMFVFQDSSA